MSITAWMAILMVCATITSLIVEGIKDFLNGLEKAYAPNVLVLIVAIIVGCGATALYYVNYQIPFNALNSIYLALMGVANWLGATLGYDKVKQTIMQIIIAKENKKA